MLDDSKQPYKLSINSVFPTLLHRTKVVSTVLVTLHGINTETLQAGQHSVGANEEGDDISEGGDGDSYPRMLHGLPKPIN